MTIKIKYQYEARITQNGEPIKIVKPSVTELRGALVEITKLPIEAFQKVNSMTPNQVIIFPARLQAISGVSRIQTGKIRA